MRVIYLLSFCLFWSLFLEHQYDFVFLLYTNYNILDVDNRQEYDVREERKRELEFLEKVGGFDHFLSIFCDRCMQMMITFCIVSVGWESSGLQVWECCFS